MAGVEVALVQSDDEIAATFAVMSQLRPHLRREDYVATMRALRDSDGLQLLVLRDGGS